MLIVQNLSICSAKRKCLASLRSCRAARRMFGIQNHSEADPKHQAQQHRCDARCYQSSFSAARGASDSHGGAAENRGANQFDYQLSGVHCDSLSESWRIVPCYS